MGDVAEIAGIVPLDSPSFFPDWVSFAVYLALGLGLVALVLYKQKDKPYS